MTTDPCHLALRLLDGSEPCGSCGHPARSHKAHREYVAVDYADEVDAVILERTEKPATGYRVEFLGDDTDGRQWRTSECTAPSGVSLAVAKHDIAGRRAMFPSVTYRIVAPDGSIVDESIDLASAPDVTVHQVVMTREAFDAAIATARDEGRREGAEWMREEARACACAPGYFQTAHNIDSICVPLSWPNPLARIAEALGCESDEAACLDMAKRKAEHASALYDRQEQWEEILSQRDEEVAMYERIAKVLGVTEYDPESLAVAVEELAAAKAQRGVPKELRERITYWVDSTSSHPAAALLRDVHAWLSAAPTIDPELVEARRERDEGWRRVNDDTAFASPFSTIRVCRGCGCLVAGGPTACRRCVAAEGEKR